jgi:hypothetical protein
MEERPFWLKVLSALATPAIALLGFAIAWGQWATARSKLILDLFEKRREVYSAFRGPVGEAVRSGSVDNATFFEFAGVIDQAQFLFGQEVLDFIRDHTGVLARMAEATSMLEVRNLSQEEHLKFVRMKHDALREIAAFYPKLAGLMQPYMLMDQKRPWTIARIPRWFGSR